MSYPPPPWRLRGDAFLSPRLVDSSRARLFIPDSFDIVSLWPGKTVGGLYLASYGPGSALQYHELIVFAGLTRFGDKMGFWVSHIYVDNTDSMRGGREIWGLPKELARFDRSENGCVAVYQDDRLVCRFRAGRQIGLWGPRMRFPAFSLRGQNMLRFHGAIECRFALTNANWEIPLSSPFCALGFGGNWPTIHASDMRMTAEAPESIGAGDAGPDERTTT